MEQKCEKCGGELLEGSMMGMHGLCFYPSGEAKKINPKRSPVLCDCCKQCGAIQNIRATKPERL